MASGEVIKQFLVGLGFGIDEAGLSKFVGGIATATARAAVFGAAVTAAAGLVMKGIGDVAKDGEKLDLLAQKFNSTAAAMDEFGDTADIMGIGADKAFESMNTLNRVVGEAALGIGRGKIILEKLGIAAKDSSGHVRATTDVMADLQKKLAGMDRGQAMAIMEKMGLDPEMLRMFNGELGDTAAVSKELADIDTSVGFNFDENIAESKAYQAQNRSMMVQVRLLQQWFTKLWAKLATDLMPMARAGLKKVSDAFESFRKMLQDNGKKIIEALRPIIETIMKIGGAFVSLVGRMASVIGSVLSKVIGMFVSLNGMTDGWAGYILAALAAWKYLNLGFLATPIGMLIAAGVAVLALYDDFMTWKEGGDSLIDWGSSFGGTLLNIIAVLGSLAAAIAIVKGGMVAYSMAMSGVSAVMGIVNGVMSAFNLIMAMNPIALVVLAVAGLIAAGIALVANWDTVKKWFASFFDWISSKFAGLGDIVSSISGIFGGDVSVKPSPSTQRAITGGGQSVNQQTVVNVTGAGDPHATAKAVSGAQGRVNADMARNMKGAAK